MAYDGTPVASPIYAAGKWSQAVQFNGSTQRIDISSALDAATVAESTYCVDAWVKLLAHPASFARAFSGKAAVVAFNGSGQAFFVAGNGAGYTQNYDFADGNWHHFAVILTGGNAYYLVDGTVVGTQAAVASTSETVGVGAQGGTTGGECNCLVDELRFSKVARFTVGAPGTTYTMPSGPYTADSDTLALYHFNGDANDSGGSVATGMTVAGSSAGRTGVPARYAFTPTGGLFTGTATLSAPVGGTWSPTTLTWAGTSTAQAATFTPAAAGSGNVTATGTGLTVTPQAVTVTAAPAGAGTAFALAPFGPGYSGLTTVGVAVKNASSGATVQSREQAGVYEAGTGVGDYAYPYPAAGPGETLLFVWDTGGGGPVYYSEHVSTMTLAAAGLDAVTALTSGGKSVNARQALGLGLVLMSSVDGDAKTQPLPVVNSATGAGAVSYSVSGNVVTVTLTPPA